MAGSANDTTDTSSGEEEVSTEASDSESEPYKTSAPPPSSIKTQPPPTSSTDESDSQSESDTDKTPERPQLPDPTIKPLASKPMDVKPISKNPNSSYSPPTIQSTGKRPAVEDAEDEGGDLKRVKKMTVMAVAAPDADNGGEKKQLFQRLWSEDNEIELIQGMINYVEEKGKDPLADVNDFHEFVKKSLHVDVNDKQVLTKARRLKKKFANNAAKAENTGKVRSFSNPHEKKMYELSKNLWGKDSSKNAVMSPAGKKVFKVLIKPKTNKSSHKTEGAGNGNVGIGVSVNEVEPKLVQPLRSRYGVDHLGSIGIPITDEAILNKGLELVSGAKKVEMEEKWKKLKMQELEHFLKKVDILKEQAEVVLNAIAKSGAK